MIDSSQSPADRKGNGPPLGSLDPMVAWVLGDYSPRLFISRPTLIQSASSPTGWLLVVPELPDA